MVVPGVGHGLGWWPVALSDMMSMSIRIGQAARWWCQVWVTASGMVAIRIGKAARWWCQVWVTASGMVAMLIGEACSVASEPLLLQRWCLLQKKLLFCYFCKIRIKKCAMLLQYE